MKKIVLFILIVSLSSCCKDGFKRYSRTVSGDKIPKIGMRKCY